MRLIMLRLLPVRNALFINYKNTLAFRRVERMGMKTYVATVKSSRLYDITKKFLTSPEMKRKLDVLLEQAFGTMGKGFAFGGFVLGLVPLCAWAARHIFDIHNKVKERFENPPRPLPRRSQPDPFYIPRDEVENEVSKAFVKQTDTLGLVGVIFGPAGTGKSAVVRSVCRKAGQGVVYIEIGSHCQLAYNLANACGIPVEQRNWYDALASKFFPNWTTALKLPENNEDALAYVIQAIAEGCRKYKAKHHHVPTLFIDGADILANQNKAMFNSLVEWAMKCANDNTLQIVLVSSDSHILGALDKQSIKCRLDDFIEIEDATEEEVVKLMTKKFRMPEYLAKNIYNAIGGRLSDVHKAVSMWMKNYEAANPVSEVTDNIHEKDKPLEKLWDKESEKETTLPQSVVETANTIREESSDREIQLAIFSVMDSARTETFELPDSRITSTNLRHKVRKLVLNYKWTNTLVGEIESQFSLGMEQAFFKAFGSSTQSELELKMAILKDSLVLNNAAVDAQKDAALISKPVKPPTVEDIQWNMVEKFRSNNISPQQVMDAILQLVDNHLLRITKQRTLRSYNRTAQKVLEKRCPLFTCKENRPSGMEAKVSSVSVK